MACLLCQGKRYAPYIVTSLLLLEVAFWNFYQMNQWVTSETFGTYFSYFQLLTPPLVFLLVIGVFTPDKDTVDTKQYFRDHMGIVFGLLAIFTASHFFFDSDDWIVRGVVIALLILTAIWKKPWLVYVLLAIRMISWQFSS